ncbi:MAG: hypothetical protein QXS37_06805 [Candidatus Aenigmatarchaeota archaeon]
MAKYLITFPKKLKEEIKASLDASVENTKELAKSKRMKILKKAVEKGFGINLKYSDGCYTSYKFIADDKVIWDYTIIGEEIMSKKVLAKIIERRLRKDFKTDKIKVKVLDKE